MALFLCLQPLTSLTIIRCRKLVTDAGLECLQGLPLTSLHLESEAYNPAGFKSISSAGLQALVGMPLTDLSLRGCHRITDLGLMYLQGMKHLRRLDLEGCFCLTEAGIFALRGLPIAVLGLSECKGLAGATLGPLLRLPLTRLCVGGSCCERLREACYQHPKLAGLVVDHLRVS